MSSSAKRGLHDNYREEPTNETNLMPSWDSLSVPGGSSVGEATATATEQLDKLIPPEKLKVGRINTIMRRGSPYQQIIQLGLEARTDLAIMAVRGRDARDARDALNLAVFGSTTYSVIQLGPCPVLAVHV